MGIAKMLEAKLRHRLEWGEFFPIATIGMELFRQKKPKKVMKSAILSHYMAMITLVFFAYSNQILAGIFKRICLKSLTPR